MRGKRGRVQRSVVPADGALNALRRKLIWLPPFLLGLVGASAGELAGGLLLYTGEGFLRSLTVILAIEMLGLGLGLASSRHLDPGDIGPVRRRWLLALLALAGGAGYATAWAFAEGFSAVPMAQGLGLALLGGFPLFAVGSALGGVSALGGGSGEVGAPAALGGAAGVTAMGLLGIPNLEPTSVFLFSVVAVSVAALVHGWQIDGRVVVRVLAEDRGTNGGPVIRLEERIRGDTSERGWLITVDGRPAAGVAEDQPLLSWERAALELLGRDAAGGGRILLVGGAGGGLVRALEAGPRGTDLVVVEPWKRVMALQSSAGLEEPEISIRREWSTVELEPPFGAVVVNLRLLPGGGPVAGAGLTLLESVAESRASEGILLLGGVEMGEGSALPGMVDWVSRRSWSPPLLSLLEPSSVPGGPAGSLLLGHEGTGGGLLVGRSGGAMAPEPRATGMELAVEGPRSSPTGEPEEWRLGP